MSTLTIVVREIDASEAAMLLPLLNQVQSLHSAAYPQIFRTETDTEQLAAFLNEWVSREGVTTLVAESDAGAFVGYAIGEIHEHTESPLKRASRLGLIQHVAVDEEYRCLGIGLQLIEELKSRLRASGIERVQAQHYIFNAASAALMRKAGLEPLRVTVEGTA